MTSSSTFAIRPPRHIVDGDYPLAWQSGRPASGSTLTGQDLREDAAFPVPQRTYQHERLAIRVETAAPAWVHRTAEAVLGLLALPENWDSYGAPPIPARSAVDAFNLINAIGQLPLPNPGVVPTSDGRIQVEWHVRNIDLEIRTLGGNRFHLFFQNAGEAFASETDIGPDLSTAIAHLELLARTGT